MREEGGGQKVDKEVDNKGRGKREEGGGTIMREVWECPPPQNITHVLYIHNQDPIIQDYTFMSNDVPWTWRYK